MKKRLFLSVIAASLTLFSCGKRKDEEPADDPVDPLTPEQRESATKTNDIIYSYVKDSYDEQTAESNKAYILACSEHAALKGVDGAKIAEYLKKAEDEVDSDNPLTIFSFVVEVRTDGVLDDFAYFGAALGQTYLKIETDKADEDSKPYFTVALAEVEKETDNIAQNAYAIVDNVLGMVESLSNSSTEHPEISQFVTSIMANEVIDGAQLKLVLHDLRVMIIEELAKTEENVKYFASEAATLGAGFLAVTPNVPAEVLDFVKELSLEGVVGSIYNGAKKFGEAIDNLPDSYYEHFGEITIPEESYAYAILGVIDTLVGEVELPSDQELDQLPIMLTFGLSMLYQSVKSYVPETLQPAIEAVLGNSNLLALFQGVVKCAKDLIHAEWPELSIEETAHIFGLLASIDTVSIDNQIEVESFADLKNSEIVDSETQTLIAPAVNEMETHITDHADQDKNLEDKVIVIGSVTENEGTFSYEVTEVDYSFNYSHENESFLGSLTVTKTTVTYHSLDEVAALIDTYLTKLVSKENSDLIVDDVLGVAIPLAKLLNLEQVKPLIQSAFADDMKTYMIVSVVIQLVINFEGKEVSDGLKAILNDALVVIKDVLDVFMPHGDTPAELDFSKVFSALISVSPDVAFEMIKNMLPESCLENLKQLAEDVYSAPLLGNLVPSLLLTLLSDELNEYGIEVPNEMDAEKFGKVIYDLAVAVLC